MRHHPRWVFWQAAVLVACSSSADHDVPRASAQKDGSAPPVSPDGSAPRFDSGKPSESRDARASDARSRDAGASDASMPAPDAALVATKPVVDGAFWTIAHQPDLGAISTPGQQPVDFSVWQAADGTWQLWSCVRGTNVGGNTRLLYRWEGKNLTDSDWTPVGIAMEADPSLGETPGGLQAPFVIRVGGTFHLFYGDWEHICHATSTDGKTFTRVIGADGKTGMFTEGIGLNTRDPMLLQDGSRYLLYYATSDGADYVRSSTDLASFGTSTRVAYGGSAGTGPGAAECPFAVKPDANGPYFLFRTQHYGGNAQTSVYRSTDPTNFGIDDDSHLVETLPVAAPEIVHTDAGWFIAALRADLQGIQVARLSFQP